MQEASYQGGITITKTGSIGRMQSLGKMEERRANGGQNAAGGQQGVQQTYESVPCPIVDKERFGGITRIKVEETARRL